MFMEVQKRGPKAFAALIDSLKESGNSVAASILDPSVQIVNTPSPLPEDTQKYCFFYKNISKCFNSFFHSKVWNLPTYSVPPPETPKYPSYYVEPPLVEDKEPLEIRVKPSSR